MEASLAVLPKKLRAACNTYVLAKFDSTTILYNTSSPRQLRNLPRDLVTARPLGLFAFHRNQRLELGGLAKCGGVLRRNTNLVESLLRKCGVIDDQTGILAASQLVGLKQLRFTVLRTE